MEMNTTALIGFRTRWETMFNQAFNLATPQIDKIALVVNTGRVEQVTHRWLKGIPGLREFVDTRTINNVDTAGFTLKNKLWEDTIGIPRVDLERDQYGIYDPLVSRMGQTAKLHRDALGFGLLSAALDATTRADYVAYDGQPFYGTHTYKGGSYNNVTSSALNAISLQTGIADLRNRRDSQGNPLLAATERPLLIIPPALEFTAASLANLSFIVGTQPGTGASSATSQAAATENILKGTFDYIVSPYLATPTEWHLTINNPLFKPLIFQIEQDVEFLSWDKFLAQWTMYDQFVMGVRALYNVGVGLPEMVYASTGA